MIWLVFTFGVLVVFVTVVVFRLTAIARLPVHLRWEIAPIPGDASKGRYGGSSFEEHEWWRRPHRRSRFAPIIYMAKEILVMKGIWVHNRSLWSFTFGLHAGLYLTIFAMLLITLANGAALLLGPGASVPDLVSDAAASLASLGYPLGAIGTTGLLLMRIFGGCLRSLSNASTYVNLTFLWAVFVSGCYTCIASDGTMVQANALSRGLMTIDSGLEVAFPLSLHVALLLLFILYLPFTNMLHFAAKYFMYHAVRWDDEPQNPRTAAAVDRLLSGAVAWSAGHIKGKGGKSWKEITVDCHDEMP